MPAISVETERVTGLLRNDPDASEVASSVMSSTGRHGSLVVDDICEDEPLLGRYVISGPNVI